MKRKIILIALAIFLLGSGISQAQQKPLPPYKTVVKKFCKVYNYYGDWTLAFAKKKTGWWIYETDLTKTDHPTRNWQLFWSAKTGKFYQTKYEKNIPMPDEETLEQTFTNQYDGESYFFARSPYYGYTGWENDVIADYGDKKDLSDTTLEGLARAYFSKESSYLWKPFSTEQLAGDTSKMDPVAPLSRERLQNYLKYVALEIKTDSLLMLLNPTYDENIGDPFIKYSGDIFYRYFVLCLDGKKELGKSMLRKNLFGPALIASAKNYLNSVAKNGILFTTGDNASFPLWYIQITENYRTDVTVINPDFLSAPVFLKCLKTGKWVDNNPVKMAWNEKFALSNDYETVSLDYTNTADIQSKYLSINQIIKTLSSDNSIHDVVDNKMYYPTSNMFIKAPENEVFPNNVLDTSEKKNLMKIMRFTIANEEMTHNDVALLDIIAENHWVRPIYFSNTAAGTFGGLLNPYYQLEGLASRLVPKVNTNDSADGNVNTAILYKNLMEKFTWDDNIKKKPQDDLATLDLCHELRTVYNQLAKDLLAEKKKDQCIKVLNRMEQLLPSDAYLLEKTSLETAELYLKVGFKTKGAYFLDEIIKNQEALLADAKAKNDDSVKQEYTEMLDEAIVLADKYNLAEQQEAYSKKLQKVQ